MTEPLYDYGKADTGTLAQFNIHVPGEVRLRFLQALQDIAKSQGMIARIRPIHHTLPQFAADIWNRDIAIGGANILDLEEFRFSIHGESAKLDTAAKVAALSEAVKSAVRDIPGVVVDDGK